MIFKADFMFFFILAILPVSRCTNSTVCFGVPGISCTSHRLSCPSPLVIQIINTSYGYRPGCNDINGLPGCGNTTCCNEEPGDCFIPFTSEEDQQVARNCNRNETCELPRFRRLNNTDTVCNGRVVSAYSKIQYDCVSTEQPITTCPTIDHPQCPDPDPDPHCDDVNVIGGVLGSLLLISVIINVGLFVYITRKFKSLSSTNSPEENNYEDITNAERDPPSSNYDGISNAERDQSQTTYSGINNAGRDQPPTTNDDVNSTELNRTENTYDGITNAGRDQPPNTYEALQVQSDASSDQDDNKNSDSNGTYYNTKDEYVNTKY